jgi:hypothetical protein
LVIPLPRRFEEARERPIRHLGNFTKQPHVMQGSVGLQHQPAQGLPCRFLSVSQGGNASFIGVVIERRERVTA